MGLRDIVRRRREAVAAASARTQPVAPTGSRAPAPAGAPAQPHEPPTGPINISRDAVEGSAETRLRHRLEEDPNDVEAFGRLAEIVRRRAAEGHEDQQRPRAAADAEWALAEELAHSGQAWFPLIHLARLSLQDDPDGAARRLATAAEREPTGKALAEGLAMLRREGKPELALNLGVGHWRPREHVAAPGREIVFAAVEAGRIGEARRHLDALAEHHDEDDVVDLRSHLDTLASRRAR